LVLGDHAVVEMHDESQVAFGDDCIATPKAGADSDPLAHRAWDGIVEWCVSDVGACGADRRIVVFGRDQPREAITSRPGRRLHQRPRRFVTADQVVHQSCGDHDPAALDNLRLAFYDRPEPVLLERVERLQRENQQFGVVAIVVEENIQRMLERVANEVFATDVNRFQGAPTLAERPSVVSGQGAIPVALPPLPQGEPSHDAQAVGASVVHRAALLHAGAKEGSTSHS